MPASVNLDDISAPWKISAMIICTTTVTSHMRKALPQLVSYMDWIMEIVTKKPTMTPSVSAIQGAKHANIPTATPMRIATIYITIVHAMAVPNPRFPWPVIQAAKCRTADAIRS